MKKILDIVFGFMFATSFIILTYPSSYENYQYWLGIAIAIGLSYCMSAWNEEDIDELKKEIEKLKKNDNE